jgi:anti-sigma factor RsiW
MPHDPIDLDALIAYALGECDAEQSRRVEARLSSSPQAARDLSRLRIVLTSLRTDDTARPPTALIAAAARLVRAPRAIDWWEPARQRVAALIHDTRAGFSAAAFRGAAGPTLLTFEAQGVVIDVRVSDGPTPSVRLVLVQVEAGEAPGTGALLHERNTVRTAEADESGVFQFEIEPGVYDFAVLLNGDVVRAPSIEVR